MDEKIKVKDLTTILKLRDPNKVIRVKPMQYTPQDREEFAKQIEELLQLKVILRSKSPHTSPAFMVEKEAEKRRGKKRMVVNYKALNAETIDDAYYLPRKQELFTLVRGMKYFTTLDCKSGFWQIRMDEESQKLTAFSCPQGHYQWTVVPFGLKQAPSIFQRHMDDTFKDLFKICCIYVDDILIFSKTEEQHIRDVLKVLQRCKDIGIILSIKKAVIGQTRIKYLGLEIEEGIKIMQPNIITKIQDFPSKIEDKK